MVWTVNEVSHMMEVCSIFFERNPVNGVADPDSALDQFRT